MTAPGNNFYISGNNVNYNIGSVIGGNINIGNAGSGPRRTADVGVLTILTEEIRAVQAVMGGMRDYRERRLRHGPLAREAWVTGMDGRPVRVAAVQALTGGTESAALAYRGLAAEFNPAVVLLVGMAGGMNKDVQLGDVVIADQVFAYDAGRSAGPQLFESDLHAGRLGHRLHQFLAVTPSRQRLPAGGSYRIHRGPIGSGTVMTTGPGSPAPARSPHLRGKILAVDLEAAGVAVAFHETVAGDPARPAWLAVRGISDTAGPEKTEDLRPEAARRAADVMALLLPFLGAD